MIPVDKMTPVLERLARRSQTEPGPDYVEGDCLIWQGALHADGYGLVRAGRADEGMTLVHRAAWIARHGQPPTETPYVLHRCDRPPCWADAHLFLGTQADNNADMARKGRARSGNALKKRCPAGHAYDVVKRDGSRGCRRCHAAQTRARRLAGAQS